MRAAARVVAQAGMLALLAGASGAVPPTPADAERYWPQWRGPLNSGEAPHARPPLEWGEGRNVRWKVEVPGAGKSTPVVWKDLVIVTSALPAAKDGAGLEFAVLAYQRQDGALKWRRTVRTEPPHEGTHKDGSFAGGSAVTDGKRVYAFFGSRGLFALEMDGRVAWEKQLGQMQTRNAFGEGSSPALHAGTLVVNWDHEGADFIAAFDAASGREKWRRDREEPTTWATPHVAVQGGRAQVVVGGTNRLRSYDLDTGEPVWHAAGLTANVIPTPVSAGGLVYAMSGFRGNALRAVRLADARGEVAGPPALAWSYDRDTPYVPSPLLYRGGLYFLKSNSGILTQLDAVTGQPRFSERLEAVPNVYASPVGAAGRVYVVGRDGSTAVVAAGPEFKLLATNVLDDHFDASPALVDDTIYLRGTRHLYAIAETPATAPTAPKAPATRRDDVRETVHGVEIVDPYRWLEDGKSAETRAWIDAQNAYTHALLDARPEREAIRQRLTALSRYDVQTAPLARGGRFFLSRRRAADDLPIHYVREGADGADTVLLDPHPLSADHTVDVSVDDISEDGRVLVYGLRRGGEDETELHVRDVGKRADLPDVLPRDLYRGVALMPDGSGFFYAAQSRQTGIRIRYHAMGTPPAQDVEVFGSGYGPSQWIGAQVAEDGKRMLLTVQHGWARNEVFLQEPPRTGPVRTIVKDVPAHFRPDFAGDRLIVQTDWKAPRWRIVEVDLKDPAPERWRDIVPEGPDTIQGFVAAGGKLVVHTLHDVSSQLKVYSLDGRMLAEVKLPGPGSVGAIQGRWGDDALFFDFTSYTTPRSTYRADLKTGAAEAWWRPQVPFEPQAFETKQVWYASKDGTRVPMFVTHRRGLALDGQRPTLLYGYGGFNVSLLPGFSAFAAWWVEQGGVYAVANLRGGGEFGEEWHRAGMLDKKQNVFDDFVAGAEWLVANRYTDAAHLAIRGGSNGGLLVGAAFTQRPELFRAVLCDFPDLDMVGYHRFENNNPPALLEYGNAALPDQFKFLSAYSPYQKVKAGEKYPAVFFTTGDADTRVPPLQARKMTARVQAATASGRPVVLLYDTKAGHAGGRPVGKVVDDQSLQLAFLAEQLGMTVR